MKKKALKVLPLGGVDEIGKNMTVLEYDNDTGRRLRIGFPR